jgi:hypothetical protein
MVQNSGDSTRADRRASEPDVEREWGGKGQETLRRQAREMTQTYGLPRGMEDDLASAAFVILWQRKDSHPTEDEARDLIRRLAQQQKQRGRREAMGLRNASRAIADRMEAPRGIPALCPKLAKLATAAPSQISFARAVLAAAATVARWPGILSGERFRLFYLAYVEGQDLDEIVRLLEAPSSRAIQKRLRRLSRRLEREMLCRMEEYVPTDMWPRLCALVVGPGSGLTRNRISSTPGAADLCGVAVHALEAVVCGDPGLGSS